MDHGGVRDVAFGRLAGFYAGLCISTCVGLFLFTRIQIPDVMVAAAMALSMWSFLRAIDDDEARPRTWRSYLRRRSDELAAEKSHRRRISGGGVRRLSRVTRQFGLWRRLRPLSGFAVIVAIAAPWHILATLRNPPYFDLTLHSAPANITDSCGSS